MNQEVLATRALPPCVATDDGALRRVRFAAGRAAVYESAAGLRLLLAQGILQALLAGARLAQSVSDMGIPNGFFVRSPSNVRVKRRRIRRTCPAVLIAEGAADCMPLGTYQRRWRDDHVPRAVARCGSESEVSAGSTDHRYHGPHARLLRA